jgi:hypothetical protein
MADEKKSTSKKAPETSGETVSTEDSYERGWVGTRNTEYADEEYALTSGPDAPYDEERGAV